MQVVLGAEHNHLQKQQAASNSLPSNLPLATQPQSKTVAAPMLSDSESGAAQTVASAKIVAAPSGSYAHWVAFLNEQPKSKKKGTKKQKKKNLERRSNARQRYKTLFGVVPTEMAKAEQAKVKQAKILALRDKAKAKILAKVRNEQNAEYVSCTAALQVLRRNGSDAEVAQIAVPDYKIWRDEQKRLRGWTNFLARCVYEELYREIATRLKSKAEGEGEDATGEDATTGMTMPKVKVSFAMDPDDVRKYLKDSKAGKVPAMEQQTQNQETIHMSFDNRDGAGSKRKAKSPTDKTWGEMTDLEQVSTFVALASTLVTHCGRFWAQYGSN